MRHQRRHNHHHCCCPYSCRCRRGVVIVIVVVVIVVVVHRAEGATLLPSSFFHLSSFFLASSFLSFLFNDSLNKAQSMYTCIQPLKAFRHFDGSFELWGYGSNNPEDCDERNLWRRKAYDRNSKFSIASYTAAR